MKRIAFILASAALLVACGERDQELGDAGKLGDKPLWQGSQHGNMAVGWTAGDKASWQKQIQARNQAQNEHNRIK